MPQSVEITETSPLLHDANCVYCHVDLELGDHVTVCHECQSPHHADCWQANRNQCATFGCNGRGKTDLSTLNPSATVDQYKPLDQQPEISISLENLSSHRSTPAPSSTARVSRRGWTLIVLCAALLLGLFLLRGPLWFEDTGAEILRLSGHSDGVWSVSYSPDGSRIVSGSGDRTVRVWDVASGEEVAQLSGHSGPVWSVSYSPDGSRIVSGSWDETVRVWDVASGEEVAQLSGHSDPVLSVSFSPDGSRIVSGSGDRTVRVWDAASGEEVTQLRGHSGGVLSVSYSPDGSRIVSGSDDGSVRVWNLE